MRIDSLERNSDKTILWRNVDEPIDDIIDASIPLEPHYIE
jgi:hypothetical protein